MRALSVIAMRALSGVDDGNTTHGSHAEGHCDTGCSDDWCVPLGIIVHIVGSIGINIGQNLQALGLERAAPENQNRPCKSQMWVIGMALFAVASVITFGALALASALILVPLESVQFIVNIAFGKFTSACRRLVYDAEVQVAKVYRRQLSLRYAEKSVSSGVLCLPFFILQ